jgi:hypothetical protein
VKAIVNGAADFRIDGIRRVVVSVVNQRSLFTSGLRMNRRIRETHEQNQAA